MGMRKLVPVVAIATALSAWPATAGESVKPSVTHDCFSVARRPADIVFACGDAGFRAEDLRWRHWGRERAVGRGRFLFNDCDPGCAVGRLRERRGRIRLLDPQWCEDAAVTVFSVAHIRYDRAWQGRRRVIWTLDCPMEL
ncbi:MAG TPA: hypothetical protein VHJ34_05285 [Actinomycetota bacterium]|nr:hypothetical protein [Actinomycetota bacterium]